MPFFRLFIILFGVTLSLWAQNPHHCHTHGHSPIGVMGGHVHQKGEWMVSYRLMDMIMDENFVGSQEVTVAEARAMGPGGGIYMMVPAEMKMKMQMLGLMFAPSHRNTFMLMFNHLDQVMKVDMAGNLFETKSRGIGDSSFTWMFSLPTRKSFKWHLGASLHMPTGSISVKDNTPMSSGNQIQLPYPMQLGSGTWDVEPSLTLNSHNSELGQFSWGAQIRGKFRTGKNNHGYSLGDTFSAEFWVTKGWTPRVSTSLRLKHQIWGNIDGNDRTLTSTPTMMPTADPNLRRGERLDIGLGLNLLGHHGVLSGHRLGLEWNASLHQDLKGPQLGVDSSWTLGYQKAF